MESARPLVGDRFPDAELLDHEGRSRSIASFLAPGRIDPYLGFDEGYPAIVIFFRGPFCPRDQAQLRTLVGAQHEFGLNGCSIIAVSVQPPEVLSAFRFGLGASWTFLSDPERQLIGQLDLVDETEGEEAFVSLPMTYVLDGDGVVRSIYDGWWSVGRPSPEELRRDIRAIMSSTRRYEYEAWTAPRVTEVRVPQQTWLETERPDPEHSGTVAWFDLGRGIGMITPDPLAPVDDHVGEDDPADQGDGQDDGQDQDHVFFSFTAIPGSGYRTIRAGQRVRFDRADNPVGPVATQVVAEH